MKKTFLALAAASLALPAVPAAADPPSWAPAHGWRAHRHAYAEHYYTTGNGIRYWRGNDGRYYCHRSNGTTGLIVGAAGGALLGRAIDTHGERTTGTVLGAAIGGLLGRQITRGEVRCR
ncbi:MAG TPA: glycine zipper 2TM domain-containing protein [Croceibacterium sp.]|nr:glycine zipper 2TM domain-containing protein [Croceibacterium sp.]